MKKILSTLLVLILVLSSVTFASSSNVNLTQLDTKNAAGNQFIESSPDGSITPYADKIHFDDILNSANYTRTFTVSPSDGNRLNIFASNKGSNTIEIDISVGGTSIYGYPKTIAPGGTHTYSSISITYEAEWELMLDDISGARMRGEARARQF